MKDTKVNSVPFERVVKRGQMYYIHKRPPFKESRELDPKGGRPAIIVSRDEDNFMSGTVNVVYLTSEHNIRFLRDTQFKLTGGKMVRSVAKCEQIDTVDKQCLGDYIGDCNEEELDLLNKALCLSLNICTGVENSVENVERDREFKAMQAQKVKAMQAHIDQLTAENADLRKMCTGASNTDYKEEAERYKQMYQDLVRTLAGR